jgi:hypothetical protein
MRAGQIDLLDLEMPILLRPSAPVSDEDLMRFSEPNKPLKIERNKEGELIVMTPVGFIGGTHEGYIAAALLLWAEQDGEARLSLPTSASSCPTAPASRPTQHGLPRLASTR